MDVVQYKKENEFYSPFSGQILIKAEKHGGKWIVYLVRNRENDKVYVGQTTKGLSRRRYQHFRSTRYGCDGFFHKALRKYGEDSFEWSVIDSGSSKEEADEKERNWISYFNSTNSEQGYNQTHGGEGGLLTEEVLAKISKKKKGCVPWNKGVPWSKEMKEKLSQSHKGQPAWNKGVPMTEERKKHLSEVKKGKPSSFKGCHHSDEAKHKMSLKSKGNQHWLGKTHSEETKRKISESLKGQHPSEETRKKQSLSHLGSHRSEETKKRMSVAQQKRWRKEKEATCEV